MPRNTNVEHAVEIILDLLDEFIAGKKLVSVPREKVKQEIDDFLNDINSGSVLLASTFLLAYSIVTDKYNFKDVPVGVRGKYGDKKLSNELNKRYVTIHNRIVAFGENLGWKGNVNNFNLFNDKRFEILKVFSKLSHKEREILLTYIIWHFYDSIKKPKAIPRLHDSYLTYGRCVNLFDKIVRKRSEGYFPQFLVSAMLKIQRRGTTTIRTHHPHAADKYDSAVGDIEEYYNGKLIAAYEVTVRPDWRNRIEGFRDKMYHNNLNKYVIIAGDIASNDSTNTVDSLLNFTERLGFDLAIVDLYEFIRVFVGDKTADQLIDVINTVYEYLLDDNLCGRIKLIDDYRKMIDKFIQE